MLGMRGLPNDPCRATPRVAGLLGQEPKDKPKVAGSNSPPIPKGA